MSLENLFRTRPEGGNQDFNVRVVSHTLIFLLDCIYRVLTDGVDVKEAHGRLEDGAEHAVVQALRGPHQHVEQQHVADEAEQDGDQGQPCGNMAGRCQLLSNEMRGKQTFCCSPP